MSSELLAEFDSFYKSPSATSSSREPALNDLLSLEGKTQAPCQPSISSQFPETYSSGTSFGQTLPPGGNQDIWNIFNEPKSQESVGNGGAPVALGPEVIKPQTPQRNLIQPGLVRASTRELFSNNVADLAESSNAAWIQTRVPVVNPPAQTRNYFSEVLFDADDVTEEPEIEDEDDFGDFETGVPSRDLLSQPEPSLNAAFGVNGYEASVNRPQSLVPSSIDVMNPLPYPQPPKSPSFLDRKPSGDITITTSNSTNVKKSTEQKSATPVTAWPDFTSPQGLTEEWGEFTDYPPKAPAGQITPVPNTKSQPISKPRSSIPAKATESSTKSPVDPDPWDWGDTLTSTEVTHNKDEPPPTNIPPPSVLLSLFPQLFELPQTTLFKSVASQTYTLKHRMLSDPSTITFLQGYLLLATVAARVVAGRKLRWKRDTHLSQAMRIGPSAAGGKGGMKLTGVDKAEVTREDREASEVIRVWKEHLGRLRSAVAVSNSSMHEGSTHLVVPEMDEKMVARAEVGAVTAPKPCIICGLKREERINKVDVQVEDSFGEWWADHWGHIACRNFWLEHEPKLRNR